MNLFGHVISWPQLYGQLLIGLINGSFYALLSLGLAVIFGMLTIVNFAHGSFFMLGLYVAYSLIEKFGHGAVGFWGGVALASVAVALLGALVAGAVPSRPLAIFFAVFISYAALNMFRKVQPKASRQLPGRLGLGVVGGVISFLASFVAAGAAFMTIPFMTWCNVPMKRAIGTAAALGFPLALASTAGYVYAGWHAAGLPSGTLGFVYLPALVPVVVASMLTAPFGARLSHRLPVRRLRMAFGVLLLGLALHMLSALW